MRVEAAPPPSLPTPSPLLYSTRILDTCRATRPLDNAGSWNFFLDGVEAFHLNPRPIAPAPAAAVNTSAVRSLAQRGSRPAPSPTLVMNARTATGSWGREEVIALPPDMLRVTIAIDQVAYHVYDDRNSSVPLYSFRHRVPFGRADLDDVLDVNATIFYGADFAPHGPSVALSDASVGVPVPRAFLWTHFPRLLTRDPDETGAR